MSKVNVGPTEPIEPLDPTLARLFAKASIADPSLDVRERVFRRATSAIAAGAIGSRPSVAKTFGARSLALAAATFVVGGVVGASLALALRPAPAPQVTNWERVAQSVPPLPSAEELPTLAPVPTTSTPSRRMGAPSATVPPLDTLRIEREMIDVARSKLASGDPRAALARLSEHAQRFPKARLEEEREALIIQALVNVGQTEDARARAKAFRERWPTSVYGPAVDATLQSIP